MKFKYLAYGFLAAVLAAVLVGFIPIKFAVKQEDLDRSENYIIVKVQTATVAPWIAIGDNKGNYDMPKDVRLSGNVPSGFNYDVAVGQNAFVCYGKSGGTKDLYGEEYEDFNVERWEILYPVKRNSNLDWIWPDSYLCIFDR